jgi:uncharacterized protein (DUF934 family)
MLQIDTSWPVPQLLERARGAAGVSIRVDQFVDGRVFSQVRALVEDEGFTGHIQVHGDLLPEQAELLARYGVTDVVLENGLELVDRPAFIDAGYREHHISNGTDLINGANQ